MALVLSGGMAAAAVGLVPAAARADSGPAETVVDFVANDNTWTVPNGVFSATFVLAGAQGGAGADSSGGAGGAGGRGGELEAVLPVQPGQTYDVQVGSQGFQPARLPGEGGWPGGGNGEKGGGGGGATTVGLAGGAPADLLLVAGGGGGGSEATTSTQTDDPGSPGVPGGAGGGLADATAGSGGDAQGGGPGTDSAGGAGGQLAEVGADGSPGASLQGGDASGGAGAGGAGWYGGGGGGWIDSYHRVSGAGGGGSGHAAAIATDVVSHPGVNYGAGYAQIRYTTPAAPAISGTPPTAHADQPYSFTFGRFGSPAPTFALTGGYLPDGMALSSDGVLSGTPHEVGNYPMTVTATNGVDPADTEHYWLTVDGVAPTISGTPPAGTVGVPYSFAYTVTGHPAPSTFVYTDAPQVPPGLSLSGDGHLTGTPTAAGTYTFDVIADNGVGDEVDLPSTVTIAAVTPPAITGTPQAGGVGEPYSFTFTTTGSPAPTVTKSAGSLPPGLTLSRAGKLSGSPTAAGTYHFTVRAANGAGTPATEAVTLQVQAPPKISIADASTTEGNSGTHALTFTVTLSRPSSVPVTVHWATANGTATAGSDYVAGSGTLTFAPGTTTATVPVQVKGDRTKEPTETFTVRLSSPGHASIGDGSGTGTIRDDD